MILGREVNSGAAAQTNMNQYSKSVNSDKGDMYLCRFHNLTPVHASHALQAVNAGNIKPIKVTNSQAQKEALDDPSNSTSN